MMQVLPKSHEQRIAELEQRLAAVERTVGVPVSPVFQQGPGQVARLDQLRADVAQCARAPSDVASAAMQGLSDLAVLPHAEWIARREAEDKAAEEFNRLAMQARDAQNVPPSRLEEMRMDGLI